MEKLFRFMSMLLTALILLSSCGKNLAKRYKWGLNNSKMFETINKPEKFVEVKLNSALIVEQKEKEIQYNILSLSERGQESYIKAVLEKSNSKEEFIKLINLIASKG